MRKKKWNEEWSYSIEWGTACWVEMETSQFFMFSVFTEDGLRPRSAVSLATGASSRCRRYAGRSCSSSSRGGVFARPPLERPGEQTHAPLGGWSCVRVPIRCSAALAYTLRWFVVEPLPTFNQASSYQGIIYFTPLTTLTFTSFLNPSWLTFPLSTSLFLRRRIIKFHLTFLQLCFWCV
jgi:hypothetical protein